MAAPPLQPTPPDIDPGSASGLDRDVEAARTEAADGDGWVANRAKLALAAECSAVGVQQETEAVQSEVACVRHWFSKRRELYLHKDCVCAMLQNHTSKIVLMPSKTLASFPECCEGEIPVAVRLPKDDTQVKDKKNDKKAKTLKFPKYGHFRAVANWPVDAGAILEVEGVCLGYRLSGTAARPLGCKPVEEGCGDPEPLEMLSVTDVAASSGPAVHQGDFLRVQLRESRSAGWKMGSFLLRTVVEIASVHIFLGFLGTEPNSYSALVDKPWGTISNDAFHWPAPFSSPKAWRAPGFERIWNLYIYTFAVFLAMRLLMVLLWSVLPSRGRCVKPIRYALAALYPLAVVLPFKLYLLYYFGALTNCKQCDAWHCGVYSQVDALKVDVSAFMAAGGCNITDGNMLGRYHQYVHVVASEVPEHPHCANVNNRVLDIFGISLDTTQNEGTCHTREDSPPEQIKDAVIFEQIDQICGPGSSSRIRPATFKVTERDRQELPWSMFAQNLPVRDGNCSSDGAGFEHGPYIYYNPAAQLPNKVTPVGAICVCRSAHGARDCFREVEGSVDRCAHFTGQPVEYGSLLQFDGIATLSGKLLHLFQFLVVPVYALFTTFAWDELPMGGQDKFDLRVHSRMRLDILDAFLFYAGILRNDSHNTLPVLKFVFPDVAWRDFEMYVWCAGWVSAYAWMSLVIFLHVFDRDPDKTPKMWKSVKDIFETTEQSAIALEYESRASDPYTTAVRKQSVLYEKEVQKLIKKRTVVDVLEDGVDFESATFRDWRRCTIVFSNPKVKDLKSTDYDHDGKVFTLYLAGAWPWSRKPPPDVWRAETWEEFVANAEGLVSGGNELSPEDLGMTKVSLTYAEALTRVRARSGYGFLDPRVLGWCHLCGRQPRFELKKLKEDDHRIPETERMQGFSETYYNKYKFDWFERNIEFFGSMRSLGIDLLFLFTRLAKAMWVGGFDNMMSTLLVLKNLMFSILGVVYLLSCGNSKHRCGTFDHSPLDLIAKCIERTKVGKAIKLSMLMPLRILIECLSCGMRVSMEERQEHCSKRLRMLLLQRAKASPDCDARADMDHEIRLLASELQEHEDILELLDTKNIVRMRANVKAKDIVG